MIKHEHFLGDQKIIQFVMPGIESNMYIITEGGQAFIIDPFCEMEAIEYLKSCGVEAVFVFLTHEHWDHISGVNFLRGFFETKVMCTSNAAQMIKDPNKNLAKYFDVIMLDKTPEQIEAGLAYKDENYSCLADIEIEEEWQSQWENHTIRAYPAPGHSRGGCLLFFDCLLFTGDNLVNGAGVICRLPGGSWKDYQSITKPLLDGVEDESIVFPGHGMPEKMAILRKYMCKFGRVDM